MTQNTTPDDISPCPSCNCMTHTVDSKCGKCGAVKQPQTIEGILKTYKQHIRVAENNQDPIDMELAGTHALAVIDQLVREKVIGSNYVKKKTALGGSIHTYVRKMHDGSHEYLTQEAAFVVNRSKNQERQALSRVIGKEK